VESNQDPYTLYNELPSWISDWSTQITYNVKELWLNWYLFNASDNTRFVDSYVWNEDILLLQGIAEAVVTGVRISDIAEDLTFREAKNYRKR
jgi:hypothetical protein